MAYRSVLIESDVHLSVRNRQLVIRADGDHSLPVEDLSALVLESRQSTITTAALSLLGQSGCAVYVCDEKHMPCGVLQPFAAHSRELAVVRRQLEAPEPLKRRPRLPAIFRRCLSRALPAGGRIRATPPSITAMPSCAAASRAIWRLTALPRIWGCITAAS